MKLFLRLFSCAMLLGNQAMAADIVTTHEPLQADSIKLTICEDLAYYLNDDDSFERDSCLAMGFTITEKRSVEGTITLMVVDVETSNQVCKSKVKRVFPRQYVNEDGDIRETTASWEAETTNCLVTDTFQVLEEIANDAVDQLGDGSVERYDVNSFDQSTAVEEIEQSLPSGSCSFETYDDTNSAIEMLSESYMDRNAGNKIDEMTQQGLIRAVIYRGHDGVDGESENCSYSEFHIYTNDGYLLRLDYDQTT